MAVKLLLYPVVNELESMSLDAVLASDVFSLFVTAKSVVFVVQVDMDALIWGCACLLYLLLLKSRCP